MVCEFLNRSASDMRKKLQMGGNIEKELRRILSDFIKECGVCLCESNQRKSKFYLLFHKMLCHGLKTLNFKEMAYLHRKIFIEADKLQPGYLINMLICDGNISMDAGIKCCSCKNTRCCNNSEEMLRTKGI